ncbi:hypothetical protein AB1Y20_023745 [Prymnesium parvum]|uniref:mitogen-activated protein kinase kinase n=1 Tax=Prymnesium parvum TaxID=97485 RepID=A0AB34JFL1_PRYPA
MPLKKPMMALTLDDDDDDDAGENMVAPDGRAPAGRSLRTQASYKLSDTMTFAQGGVVLRGSAGMVGDDGTQETDIELADLHKVRQLGAGVSARVYLVEHRRTGEQFALKELTAMADTDARHMAVNELKIAHNAHCPHLIRFVDAFFNEGKISIVMELADGGSLDDVIKRAGRIPEPPCQGVGVSMLQGLQYLHRELHQVHRDIKPANVMIKAGVLKLSDFGISKQLESTAAFATTQVGTTVYMSPERMLGEEHSYASDIWSVGLTVLEAYLGEMPFPIAGSFMEQVSLVVDGPAPAPPPGSSAEFEDFVAQCLQKDANLRGTVTELLSGPWLINADDGEFGRWLQTL